MIIDFVSLFLPEILIAVFGVVVLFQILYYILLFCRFSFHKLQTQKLQNTPPVSIIIVAKNDAHLLIKSLPEILVQNYPQFEVVVVNDNSNDETQQLVLDFKNRFPNLKLVHLESSVTNIKGKKFPLSLGIKAATYEHVLLTDADCLPVSNQWIRLMARHFNDTTKVVLGFSRVRHKTGFINALIRFDKLHQAIQYFSYCLAKFPFMGMGQNLAYTKTIFFKHKGFASQNHLQFGDDDLFINRVADPLNCAIEYAKDAHTVSYSGSNFYNWLLLKTFRLNTRKLYTNPKPFLLNFYHFLLTFSYIALGVALCFTIHNLIYLIVLLGILLLKLTIQYICFGFAATKLDQKRLIPHILFFDLIFAVLNPVVFVVAKFRR
jgi:glycosyltransferase involved in cell wall biosynthesis